MTSQDIIRDALAEAERKGSTHLKPLPVRVVREACEAVGSEADALARAAGNNLDLNTTIAVVHAKLLVGPPPPPPAA